MHAPCVYDVTDSGYELWDVLCLDFPGCILLQLQDMAVY